MPEVGSRDAVLLVDDSPETIGMLTDALEQVGVTVLVAMSGRDALSLVNRITPDVILLDAVMPDMDGFETCRRLKQNKQISHVPVIFMTGLSETEHILRALAAGGVDYVTKPIILDELFARMHVHLANARLAQSARVALDAAGSFLLAVNGAAQIQWTTPQAAKLLGAAFGSSGAATFTLPADVKTWLKAGAQNGRERGPEKIILDAGEGRTMLRLSYVGQIGADEFLLRISEDSRVSDESLLRTRLSLTTREAEVLLWIARGKSNRDIGDILGISPRTVNKHLEQIYTKLGVENRAAAATCATRMLGDR